MTVTASNAPSLSCRQTCSPRIGWSHSTCSATASFPHFFDTSNHLSENAPHMQLSTLPAPTRLRIAPSITPHADEVERNTGCQNAANVFSETWTGPGMKSFMQKNFEFRILNFESVQRRGRAGGRRYHSKFKIQNSKFAALRAASFPNEMLEPQILCARGRIGGARAFDARHFFVNADRGFPVGLLLETRGEIEA